MQLKSLIITMIIIGSVLTGCVNEAPFIDRHQVVSTAQLQLLVSKADVVVIDTRDSNYYNGWPQPGQGEGGHIPGAHHFSYDWVDTDEEYLDSLLDSKGISHTRRVVLYGDKSRSLAKWLAQKLPFTDSQLFIYEKGTAGWLEAGLPLETMKNYRRLVSPQWLAAQQKETENLVIIDASWGIGIRYLSAHIPGAVHLDTGRIESKSLWNLRSTDVLSNLIREMGISGTSNVVVYGEDMTAAARVVFALQYAGIENVKLLNGGWGAWQAAGLPVEVGRNLSQNVSFPVFLDHKNNDILVLTDEIESIVNAENQWLVSVRSWPEYIGETSGYDYIKPVGRIPGAQWGRSGSDPWQMQDYLNPDGTLREYHDLMSYWQSFGASSEDTLVFYCGTGWRASLAWFAALVSGYDQVRVYDGGWYEWSHGTQRAVITGEPDVNQFRK